MAPEIRSEIRVPETDRQSVRSETSLPGAPPTLTMDWSDAFANAPEEFKADDAAASMLERANTLLGGFDDRISKCDRMGAPFFMREQHDVQDVKELTEILRTLDEHAARPFWQRLADVRKAATAPMTVGSRSNVLPFTGAALPHSR